MGYMKFSVIVPVYGEEAVINSILCRIRQEAGGKAEIIVVDGHPENTTLKALSGNDIIKVHSQGGRGRQMNAGAASASGSILVFLHSDTFLPDGAFAMIEREIRSGFKAGAFDLGYNRRDLLLHISAAIASLRSRITRIPFGDQAQFFSTSYFRSIGGFRRIPLMEDVEIMARIKKMGGRIAIINRRVRTSPRRIDSEGFWRCTVRNWKLQALYALGVPAEKLVVKYYGDKFAGGTGQKHGKKA
jgi:rSAM/selenodomain-associated transferase 2